MNIATPPQAGRPSLSRAFLTRIIKPFVSVLYNWEGGVDTVIIKKFGPFGNLPEHMRQISSARSW